MPLSAYLPEHMGSATLTPSGQFVAGSHAELTLTYTAGTFGIDDSGMLKVSWRTTSDMAKPQFSEPAADAPVGNPQSIVLYGPPFKETEILFVGKAFQDVVQLWNHKPVLKT